MVSFDGINSGSQSSRLGPIKRHPFSVFHMYTTQSFTVVLRSCCPVPVLARTSTGRVGLRNAAVREFACSGEDGNHVFGECRRRHDYSLLFPVPGGDVNSFLLGRRRGTTSSRRQANERDCHCNISALHRAGRLQQQSTMLLSGASGSAAGYANLILKVAIFVISVNSMIGMFYLRNSTCHALVLVLYS